MSDVQTAIRPPIPTPEEVLQALSKLRVSSVIDEYSLQKQIQEHLDNAGISYQREYRLAPRTRLDFLVQGGILIEVKRGRQKPSRKKVTEQLARYAAFDEIQAIILVVDRNLHLARLIQGKPCHVFGLHKLWGIAL
ncbi:MAG: hypothetical protein JWN30_2325 [Bacilli bacterium]|nr:hypothetical protein [Bacilli bacterium]